MTRKEKKTEVIYPLLSEGTLTPAYGRDYKRKETIIQDFRNGKDFYFNQGRTKIYCSIRDGVIGEMVKLRYDRGNQAIFYCITAQDFMTSGDRNR